MAMRFFGGNDYDSTVVVDLSQPYSLGSWFRVDAFNASDTITTWFLRQYSLNSGPAAQISATTKVLAQSAPNGGGAFLLSPITLGVWYHTFYAFTGTRSLHFLNGVLVANNSASPFSAVTDDLTIGRRSGAALLGWDVSVQDVRIFNTGISDPNIVKMMMLERGPLAITGLGCVARYPLSANDPLKDFSGFGHNFVELSSGGASPSPSTSWPSASYSGARQTLLRAFILPSLAGLATVATTTDTAILGKTLAYAGTANLVVSGAAPLGLSEPATATATVSVHGSGTIAPGQGLLGTATINIAGTGTPGLSVPATGAGTVDAAGTGALGLSVPATGAGTVDAAGTGALGLSVPATGSGTVDAAGAGPLAASAELDGTATLQISGTVRVDLAGQAAVSVSGSSVGGISESLSGSATLNLTGSVRVDLAGQATIAVSGTADAHSAIAITGAGTVDATGTVVAALVAAFAATAAIQSTGLGGALAAAGAFGGPAMVRSTGVGGALAGLGALSSTAVVRSASAGGALAATDVLSGAATVALAGTVNIGLAGSATIQSAGSAAIGSSEALVGTAQTQVSGVFAIGSIAGTASVSCTGPSAIVKVSVALSGTGVVNSASAGGALAATDKLAGVAAVVSSGQVDATTEIPIDGQASVNVATFHPLLDIASSIHGATASIRVTGSVLYHTTSETTGPRRTFRVLYRGPKAPFALKARPIRV